MSLTAVCRVLSLAADVHLESDRHAQRHLLRHGQGVIALNEVAAEILKLCNGTNTRREVLEMSRRHLGRGSRRHVRAFLEAARRHAWIVETEPSLH
jgi:Coenzyme PQQ synthesis protein D (PqqD)